MTIDEFKNADNGRFLIDITEDGRYHFLFGATKVKRKPPVPYYAILDYRMPEGKDEHRFSSVEEAFEFKMTDGRTVGEVIGTWSALPDEMLDADPVFHYK